MEQLKFRSKGQHKVLFGLLSFLKWINRRDQLAYQYSKERTTSTSELYYHECDELIQHLMIEAKKLRESQEQTKLETMQKKFFYYCHELGWKKNGKLDYKRINNWLLKYGYLKKPLDDYTEQQLFKLLQQIEKVVEKRKKPDKDES